MTEQCTCGTLLVENARFCHRCGRPTGEIAAEEAEAPPPAPTLTPAPVTATIAQVPVGFRNPLALRVAFIMSLGIMLLQMIPGLNLLFAVWWLAAGWLAVAIYRKLTGAVMTISAGARLGSITGVLAFASMTVTFAFAMVFTGRQMLDEMVKQTPQVEQMVNDPVALSAVILIILVLMFAMVVGTCAAGGALGARFTARGSAT